MCVGMACILRLQPSYHVGGAKCTFFMGKPACGKYASISWH